MLNAGDLLTDDALNKLAQNFVPGYDVIKGNTIRWNPETNYRSVETPVIHYPAIPFNFLVCHQSTYVSKAAYAKFGGYLVNFKIAMDFELMLRLTRYGCKFKRILCDLAIFRMGGISQNAKKRRVDEMCKAMQLNGRNWLQTTIFIIYVRFRTFVRNILNRINPDLKNRIMTKTIKD